MELYLITGFLGAGKTTFLKNFARQFAGPAAAAHHQRIRTRRRGRHALRELDAALDEISNGSIFCACRLDQFEAALEQAAADAPDVVLVEASGLADPPTCAGFWPNFPLFPTRAACASQMPRGLKRFSTARACPRQLAVSSLVLLNKTDLATEAQCAGSKSAYPARQPGGPHPPHAVRTVRAGMAFPDRTGCGCG